MANDAEIHQHITAALKDFRDPETGRPISKTGQVTDWSVTGGHVRCKLALTSHSSAIAEETAEAFRQFIMAQSEGIQNVEVELGTFHRPPAASGQFGLKIKSIIAVGSGKGGVG